MRQALATRGLKSRWRGRDQPALRHNVRCCGGARGADASATPCCLYPEDGDQYLEAEANARLIAAAPDLYDALKAAESALAIAASYRDDHKTLMQVVTLDNARDVLAKARGTP